MCQVRIHRLVVEEDFKRLDASQQQLIFKAIKKKLTLDPEGYGKPLSGQASDFWRLRVEDCRVIYRIEKEQVLVLVIKVGIRRDAHVYEELYARIKKLEMKGS